MRRPNGVIWLAALALCGPACAGAGDEPPSSAVGEQRSSLMLDGEGKSGRSDQWVRGTDGMLYRRYSEGRDQHDWQYLGNNGVPLISDPTAASWGKSRVDVFVVNRNATIDHGVSGGGNSFWWVDNWGTPWQGSWLSGLDVVSPRSGVLDLFVQAVGPTGHGSVYHRRWDNGWDSGWVLFGTRGWPDKFVGGPGAVAGASSPDSLDVFVTGRDDASGRYVIYRGSSSDGGRTATWQNMGEPGGAALASGPDAASWSNDRIDLVVRDTAGAIRHLYTDDLWHWYWNVWGGFPAASADPSIVAMGPGKLRVFSRAASDGALWQCTWENADLGCKYWGGVLLGGPDASSWGLDCDGPIQCATGNVCIDHACVAPSWPPLSAYSYIGDAPMNWDSPWTEGLNGVAHSDHFWYISNEQHICKIPLNEDPTRFGDWYDDSWCLGPLFYADEFHYGDVDMYKGLLFVPIERKGQNAVLSILRDLDPDHYSQGHPYQEVLRKEMPQGTFAWLAINPRDGLLYTAQLFDRVPSLTAYRLHEPDADNPNWDIDTANPISIPLAYQNGSPIKLDHLQGGVFSPNGHLYVVAGNPWTVSDGGVWAFETNGQAFLHMPFEYHPRLCGGIKGDCGDEPEGIDFLDLDANPTGNGLPGQLHVLMIDNDHWPSTDDLYFKHFRIADYRY